MRGIYRCRVNTLHNEPIIRKASKCHNVIIEKHSVIPLMSINKKREMLPDFHFNTQSRGDETLATRRLTAYRIEALGRALLPTTIWPCCNPFSQWQRCLQGKLGSHWLKVLQQRHMATVIQSPWWGHAHAVGFLWATLNPLLVEQNVLYICVFIYKIIDLLRVKCRFPPPCFTII